MIAIVYTLLVIPLLALLILSPISEVLARFRRVSSSPEHGARQAATLLFLIPAHNEAQLVGRCVHSVLQMDYPERKKRLVVVADNCTDGTARIVRAAGARCLERWDPQRPGKPEAIAWALRQLQAEDWDACVIIDADSMVHPQFATWLAARGPLGGKCVQTYNDLFNEEDSWLTRLARVLTRIRYERQFPLKQSAGLNCPPANGMAIGRDLLSSGWPAFSLTENWELYARFTAKGVAIEYEPRARLFSQEASSLSRAATQRRRWLAGRIWVFGRYAETLLRSREIGFHQKLDVIAELASPPPTLHGAATTAVLLSAPFLLPAPLAGVVTLVASASLLPLVVHTTSVIRAHPHRWRLAGSLLLLPPYVLWRIVVSVRTLSTLREGRWKRSERN